MRRFAVVAAVAVVAMAGLAAGARGPAATPPPPRLMNGAELDALVAEVWRAAGVTPAPEADDAEFLRRVSLDLTGRIPTRQEAAAFLADGAGQRGARRARLVDRLLASADHASHFGEVYADLLLGPTFRKPRLVERLAPRSWFVDQFRANRPYDQMARDLLTFSGPVAPGGPGVFLASHAAMGGGPEVVASVTARAFLGLQLQCAQCHDHPYDKRYKQEDFYGLVAFFARTRARQQKPEAAPSVEGMTAAVLEGADKRGKVFFISDVPQGEARFTKPGALVDSVAAPRFLGREIGPAPGESRREAAARAVIRSELFAKAAVDRTWAQLFGRGLVEPWDDLGGEEDPRHPALLNRLARDFEDSGYDLRHLLRLLVLSRAYGLTSQASAPAQASASASGGPPVDPTTVFARAAVRRLPPETLFRSLLVATGASSAAPASDDIQKKVERALREYLFVFGDDEMGAVEAFNGNVPQALLLWNGEITNLGGRARPWSTLGQVLAASNDPPARMRELFLAAYARPPTDAELSAAATHLARAPGPRGYEDVFFALLTSTEMLSNH